MTMTMKLDSSVRASPTDTANFLQNRVTKVENSINFMLQLQQILYFRVIFKNSKILHKKLYI